MYRINMTLGMMSRPLTKEEASFVDRELEAALDWLRHVVHWLATFQTLLVWKEEGPERVSAAELWPRYDEFHYRWFIYYGRVYVSVNADDWKRFIHFHPRDWQRHRAVDRNWTSYDQEFLAHYAEALDEMIRDFLPGIKQKIACKYALCLLTALNIAGSLSGGPGSMFASGLARNGFVKTA